MLDDVTVSVGPKGVGGAELVGPALDPERSAGDDEKEEAVEEELTDGDEMTSGVEDAVVVAAVVVVADWALVTIVMGASALTGTTVDAKIGALTCDEEEVGVAEMTVVVAAAVAAVDSVVSVVAVAAAALSNAQELQSVVNVEMNVPCGLMTEALVMREVVDAAMNEETGNGPYVNIPIAVLAVLVRARESAPLAWFAKEVAAENGNEELGAEGH